jgi:hypothetical protein
MDNSARKSRRNNAKSKHQPEQQVPKEKAFASPEHWGDSSTSPDPDEDPEFWGEERPSEKKPALEVGELSFRPWGGVTVKDLRVADKEILLILTLTGLFLAAVLIVGI